MLGLNEICFYVQSGAYLVVRPRISSKLEQIGIVLEDAMCIVGYVYDINLSFHVFNRQFDVSYIRSFIFFGHIFMLIYGLGLEMLCLIVKLAAPSSQTSWLCTWSKIWLLFLVVCPCFLGVDCLVFRCCLLPSIYFNTTYA